MEKGCQEMLIGLLMHYKSRCGHTDETMNQAAHSLLAILSIIFSLALHLLQKYSALYK